MTCQFLSDSIQLRLRLATDGGPSATPLTVSCEWLPWLREDHDLRARIGDRLNGLASGGTPAHIWLAAGDVRTALAREVERAFADLALNVRCDLRVEVEQHSPDSRPAEGAGDGWLTWIPYDDVLNSNCDGLDADQLRHDSQSLHFSPVARRARQDLRFRAERDFRVRGIQLYDNGVLLQESRDLAIVTRKKPSITLPEIPVRHYARLGKAGQVEVRLELGNKQTLNLGRFACTVERLDGPPVWLLIDMGSTSAKMFALGGERLRAAADAGAADATLAQLLADPRSWVDADTVGPISKKDFIIEYGLPEFEKPRNTADVHSLAHSIAGVVNVLAGRYAEKGRAVAGVCWSSPDTSDHPRSFFDEVSARATGLTGDRLLGGGVSVVREHECLQYRFGQVLDRLGRVAHERSVAASGERAGINRKVEGYKKEDQTYNSSWLHRRFHARPTAPDTSRLGPLDAELKDWDEYEHLRVGGEFRNALILDAGGYTLDVFGYTEGGGEPLGQSFVEAGGGEITKRMLGYLAEQRGVDPAQITQEEAEVAKRKACSEKWGGDEVVGPLKDWTSKVYGDALEKVCNWLRGQFAGRAPGAGFPVILTGGAMKNPCLRTLIEEKVKDGVGCRVVFVAASKLCELIVKKSLIKDEYLHRFHAIAHGLHPEEPGDPEVGYDIVGGLFEWTIARRTGRDGSQPAPSHQSK